MPSANSFSASPSPVVNVVSHRSSIALTNDVSREWIFASSRTPSAAVSLTPFAVSSARTPSELASVFTDLPGSAYRVPPTYVTAEQRQVGFEWPRRAQRSFPGPRVGLLPVVVRIALVVLLAVLVIAHLPLILLGVVIWLVLTHKLRHGYAGHRHGYAGHRRW